MTLWHSNAFKTQEETFATLSDVVANITVRIVSSNSFVML